MYLSLVYLACFLALQPVDAWGGGVTQPPGGAPHAAKPHARTDLVDFPYSGYGDEAFSFHTPFTPSAVSPVANWRQEGAALVTTADTRDIVRLTNSAQGLQGVFRNEIKTRSADFNGYFDVFLGSHPNSVEPADGMGFLFGDRSPGIGSAMGIDHTARGLGLIIDTFSNSRKQHVPYLYAYISDGGRIWNPDSDGADVQLTRGCNVQMNVPVRVFVQLVDLNLKVAVSIDHQPVKTCFQYNNVPLPFGGGGYFSFSAETGHYFGYHDLLSSAFVVGDTYQHPDDVLTDSDLLAGSHGDSVGAHGATAGSGPTVSSDILLGSELDVKVHQLYMEMSDALARASPRGSDTSQASLRKAMEEMSSLTSHSFLEIERMTQETADAARTVRRLKEESISLHAYAERFSVALGTLHDSVHTLRSSANRFRADQEETHNVIIAHQEIVHNVFRAASEAAPHGILSILIFIVVQVLVCSGFLVVFKMGNKGPKTRRIV